MRVIMTYDAQHHFYCEIYCKYSEGDYRVDNIHMLEMRVHHGDMVS